MFSEQRSEFCMVYSSVWQSIRGPKGHLLLKKNLGREKDTSACEKGPEGADKAPPPQIKGPRDPCDPLAAKRSRQNPGNGGNQPSAQEALPLGITLPRGGRDRPILCPLRRERLLGLLESRKGVQPQNKRGKPKQAREAMKHPCRLASEKRASEAGRVISSPPTVPRESKESPNRPGPRMAPRQNARKKGRTAQTGDKPGCGRDKDKKKKQKQKVRVGVCPVTT